MKCPACSVGSMYEHDIGYDECDHCNFSAIYDDGRNPPVWSDEEIKTIYENELREHKDFLDSSSNVW